jgi:hypothetical protein
VLASLGLVRARSSTTMQARLALWVAFLRFLGHLVLGEHGSWNQA